MSWCKREREKEVSSNSATIPSRRATAFKAQRIPPVRLVTTITPLALPLPSAVSAPPAKKSGGDASCPVAWGHPPHQRYSNPLSGSRAQSSRRIERAAVNLSPLRINWEEGGRAHAAASLEAPAASSRHAPTRPWHACACAGAGTVAPVPAGPDGSVCLVSGRVGTTRRSRLAVGRGGTRCRAQVVAAAPRQMQGRGGYEGRLGRRADTRAARRRCRASAYARRRRRERRAFGWGQGGRLRIQVTEGRGTGRPE